MATAIKELLRERQGRNSQSHAIFTSLVILVNDVRRPYHRRRDDGAAMVVVDVFCCHTRFAHSPIKGAAIERGGGVVQGTSRIGGQPRESFLSAPVRPPAPAYRTTVGAGCFMRDRIAGCGGSPNQFPPALWNLPGGTYYLPHHRRRIVFLPDPADLRNARLGVLQFRSNRDFHMGSDVRSLCSDTRLYLAVGCQGATKTFPIHHEIIPHQRTDRQPTR